MSREHKSTKSSRGGIVNVFLKIAKIIWRSSPSAIIAQLVGAVLSAVLPLLTTYFAALTTTALAEAYAGSGNSERLLFYVVMTVILGVITNLWSVVQSYLEQLLRYRVETTVRDQMFSRLHALDFWRYDDPATIDMFDRAQRFINSFPYIFSQIINIITNLFSLVVALWILASINAWLGVILFAAIIPSGVVQFRLSRLQANHWRKNVNVRRRMYWIEHMISRPSHIPELRLYGLIRHLLKERAVLRDKDQLQMIRYERKFVIQRLGGEVLQAAAEVVVLVWVTLEIVAHRQPIGQFILVQQMASRVMSNVGGLISIYNSIDEDLVNMTDYRSFMELPLAEAGKNKKLQLEEKIVVDRVKFNYPGMEHAVLNEISLEIKRGQHVALVGENGAGKTTLVKLLTGLYRPASGAIFVDGMDLREANTNSWQQQLSVLGQDFLRYDFATAYENVWYGDVSRPVDMEQIEAAMSSAEAAEFVKKLPKGGDTYVDKWMEDDKGNQGVDLSGGQWQRLALARNFYRDAPIVILDEPTSAIDAAAEARIFRHLFKQKDRTIIAISHRLSTVKKADVIYFMKDGKIVEQGKYDELMARRGEFYEMFKEQL